MNLPSLNILLLLPLAVLSAAAVVALALDALGGERERERIPVATLIALALAAVLALALRESIGMTTASRFYRLDWLGIVGMLAALLSAAGSTFMTMTSGERDPKIAEGEYYSLMLLSTAGTVVVCSANELVTLLIGIELASLSLYALAGFHFSDKRANEAALKYFMLGAVASAIIVYGIAFLFGSTGTTVLTDMAARLTAGQVVATRWMGLGAMLILAGFFFKLALAPFHMYAPDVYQGAPTPIASLIATNGKIAGFVGLWRIFETLVPQGSALGFASELGFRLEMVVAFAALLSMILGNLGAFVQSDLKRLLAYSSIAHAGYAAMAYVAFAQARVADHHGLAMSARSALEYYLLAYVLMNLLAFGIVSLLGRGGENVAGLRGLYSRQPLAAVTLAVALLSLTGIPPTVGFFAKWQVFLAATRAGYVWLALTGAIMSIFSAYYYLRPVVLMFFAEDRAPAPGESQSAAAGLDWPAARATLALASCAAIALGPLALYL
jgi:NADH-quinone oxidoreductase subunit N